MDYPVISLSTSYLQPFFKDDGYAMLQEAARLGFKYVELGHSTALTSVEGIMRALAEGVVKVSSLHSFCPVPPFANGAVPNLFSPSTKSKIESLQWRRHMNSTLDFAVQCKAKAVVCHSGELSHFFFRPDGKLDSMLSKSGGIAPDGNRDFDRTKNRFLERSRKISESKDYVFLKENLEYIHASAAKNNILLGLENREGISELPLDWNFPKLMQTLANLKNVKVWHDVGHSMRKQLGGLYSQLKLVEETAPLICGWHLHDCSDACKDHIAIGKGCIDFKSLSKFFNPQKHIFTLELNRNVERSDAADSLKRVQDLMQ